MICSTLFLAFAFLCGQLNAVLKYQQELTLSSFKSEAEAKEMAAKFLKAAEGDPDLKVIKVRYKKEKGRKNFTFYNAIIKCHVSEPDADLLRVQVKALQNDNKLPKSEA